MTNNIDKLAQIEYNRKYLDKIFDYDKNSKNLKDTIKDGKIELIYLKVKSANMANQILNDLKLN